MHAGAADEAADLGLDDMLQEGGIADGDTHAAGGELPGTPMPPAQPPAAEGPTTRGSEASALEASGSGEERKRQAASSEGEGGPRKQPYYFEFAKKRWETEETFRLPDGSFWPQARFGGPCSTSPLCLFPSSPLPHHLRTLL